mgnify:CR=1 FL=1
MIYASRMWSSKLISKFLYCGSIISHRTLFVLQSHTKKSRLTDFIDEYIDHLNYLQDIYILNNEGLSNMLTEQLMRRLMIPVYLCSLLKRDKFIVKVVTHKPEHTPFRNLILELTLTLILII